jgi:NADH dehydrogenase
VDHDGLLNLVATASRSGVKYFQFMSFSPNANFDHPFAVYKRAVERAVRESGMAWSVLQPSAFMETQFSKMAGWDLEKGRVRMGGHAGGKSSMISLLDVADFSVAAYRNASLHNRDLPLGGPAAVTRRDALRAFEEALGKSLVTSKPPPAFALKVMKTVIRPFKPHLASVLDMITSGGPPGDDVIDMTETAKLISHPLTSVEDYAQKVAATLHSNP